jgi:hypothetical protein
MRPDLNAIDGTAENHALARARAWCAMCAICEWVVPLLLLVKFVHGLYLTAAACGIMGVKLRP